MGGLAACASCTKRMICASTPALAVAFTCICSTPLPFKLPPVSLSPTVTSTGSGSPVSKLASIWLWPSVTTPSAGTRSPGLMTTISPTSSSATGTSRSSALAGSQCATSGRKACKAAIADTVCRRARSSSHLPSCTSVITTAALSKYTAGAPVPCPTSCPISGAAMPVRSHSHIDIPHAALVPSATSNSILPLRCLMACQAP